MILVTSLRFDEDPHLASSPDFAGASSPGFVACRDSGGRRVAPFDFPTLQVKIEADQTVHSKRTHYRMRPEQLRPFPYLRPRD